jgi:ribosomal protein L16/L10AE
MLLPKRTKWRKTQKGRVADVTYRGAEIAFGTLPLKVNGKRKNKQQAD